MNPEEYLDRLIERGEHGGEAQIPLANDEVAASLHAAEVLAQLQKIEVPPGFAHRLELSIRTRARSISEQHTETIPIARPRSSAGSQPFPRRRTWIALLRLAAVLMVACIGVLTASAQSLPGDALYGLKQAEKQLTLTFANNPQNRASDQIDQLRSALVDLNTVVNDGRGDDAIGLALDTVAAKTSGSQEAVAALPAGSEREAAQQGLDDVLAQEDQTLRHLLVHKEALRAYCQEHGIKGDQWIEDIGSALNYKRKGFNQVIEQIELGLVKRLIIGYQDRFVRFGYDWIEHFCERHGTEITVMNGETFSPEEELVRDLIAIVTVFSARLHGLRSHKNLIRAAALGKDIQDDQGTQDQIESHA
jgi:hypothetical protein